jgi:phage protein D
VETVRQPVFFLEYDHRDITAYITPYVLSVAYTDHVHGKSDEIDIQIEDRDHLWKSSWYPTKGDLLTLKIGYAGEPLLPCGSFQIDEIELSGPPDVVAIKGLGTPITAPLRQKNSRAYENTSLSAVALEIAGRHSLTVIKNTPEDVKIRRITQHQERDLSFLKRVAEEYGYVFKINGSDLVFYEVEALRGAPVTFVLSRTDLLSFNLKDKTRGTYQACEVSYHDPETGELITHTEKTQDIPKGDTLKVRTRSETKWQTVKKARAHLANANNARAEGALTVSGIPKLVAGSNIELQGMHVMNGAYHVVTSKHTIDRWSGYRTDCEVNRV